MKLFKTEVGVQQIFSEVTLEDFHTVWGRLENTYGKLYLHGDYYLELSNDNFRGVLSYVPSTQMLHIPYRYITYVLPENKFKYDEIVLPNGRKIYKKKRAYV